MANVHRVTGETLEEEVKPSENVRVSHLIDLHIAVDHLTVVHIGLETVDPNAFILVENCASHELVDGRLHVQMYSQSHARIANMERGCRMSLHTEDNGK